MKDNKVVGILIILIGIVQMGFFIQYPTAKLLFVCSMFSITFGVLAFIHKKKEDQDGK